MLHTYIHTYLDDLANLSVRDGDLDAGEVGVEPPLQGGHELHVGLAARIDGLDRLGDVRGDRLLAEYVLAVLGARLDLLLSQKHKAPRPRCHASSVNGEGMYARHGAGGGSLVFCDHHGVDGLIREGRA